MSRREPRSKKERHARDVARNLVLIKNMPRLAWVESGQVHLVQSVPDRLPDSANLADTLAGGQLPEHGVFLRAIGAGGSIRLDLAQLATWARAVRELETRRDIAELIAEGQRPLRRFRAADIPGRIAAARRTLEHWGRLLQGCDAAGICQTQEDVADVDTLLLALPLRLHALGNWSVDPVEALTESSVPASARLLRLATETTDSVLAHLAALILGLRHRRGSGVDRSRTEAALPAPLRRSFRAGLRPCPSPCLWAHLLADPSHALPEVAGNEEEMARAGKVAERVALLRDVPTALGVLENLLRPYADLAPARQRIARFVAVAEYLAGDGVSHSFTPEDWQLHESLRGLCREGEWQPRDLAELFLDWMLGSGVPRRPIGIRPLARVARAAWGGLAVVARVMGQAWMKAAREHDLVPFRDSAAMRGARLCLAIEFPGLAVGADLDLEQLEFLRGALAGVAPERVRELFPVLATHLVEGRGQRRWMWDRLISSDLPVGLVDRALALDVADQAGDFQGKPGQMARYLDCVEQLERNPVPNLDPRSPWLANLYRAGRAWAGAAALVLLNRQRGTPAGPELAASLFALAQELTRHEALAGTGRQLSEALEDWNTPHAASPPRETDTLAGLLGVDRPTLVEYLHHRRLLGQGETFADALLQPLRMVEGEQREIAFLELRLRADLPEKQREHLSERLRRLSDPEVTAERRRQEVARARHRLERSLDQLRRDSLKHTLDGVYRAYLERMMGRTLPVGPLPDGLREALLLLDAHHLDQALFFGFLDDILNRRPLNARGPNRQWLDSAARAGIDVKVWLAGIKASVEVNGQNFTFATERDPLHVLKMGTYFETCLSLEGGCNAASTLTNALDVNKQVIYVRRADGAVVARKLIGATLERELVGYVTYASTRDESLVRRLHEVLAGFAARCNLRLSDSATPPSLHGAFWYDDGNEAWLAGSPLLRDGMPDDLPGDDETACEWNLVEALRTNDSRRLSAVATSGCTPWREAALFRLMVHHPGAGSALDGKMAKLEGRRTAQALLARGESAWLESSPTLLGTLPGSELVFATNWLPSDAAAIEEGLGRLARAIRMLERGTFDGWSLGIPPGYLALASTGTLLRFLQAADDWCDPEAAAIQEGVEKPWADILEVAWLRDGDARPFARALEEGRTFLVSIFLRLASRVAIPGLAPALRRRLKEDRHPEPIALALGTQGDPQDGPRLLQLLQRRPGSLTLAVAVVRTGDEASAEEARRLWCPPDDFASVLDDTCWLSLARELGSARLARRLARALRRALPEFIADWWGCELYTRASLVFSRLPLLALPGPDGDASAVLEELKRDDRFRRHENWSHDIPALAESAAGLRRLPEMRAKLRQGGQPALEALRWWRGLWDGPCERNRFWGDDRFDAAVRDLAVRGSGPARAEALAAWRDLSPTLGQVGVALDVRDPELVDGRLRAVLDGARVWSSNLATETALAWAERLPVDVRLAAFSHQARWFDYERYQEADVSWLLGLERGGPERRSAIESLLRTWEQADWHSAARFLHAAFAWLRPELAEELGRRLLASEFIEHQNGADLAAILSPRTMPQSYRWQRMLLNHVAVRQDEEERRSLADEIPKTGSTRSAWLLAELSRSSSSVTSSGTCP